MMQFNDGNDFLFQGRRDAILESIPKNDPVMNRSMKTLEKILIQEEERRAQLQDEIDSGVRQAFEGYEFDEEEFVACLPDVVMLLKNKGDIPTTLTNMMDRARMADSWYVFCNALVTRVISCDVSLEDRQDPTKAIVALGSITIDDDFVEKYLRPHSISLYRYDTQSPYKDISQELSLPVLVLTEGIINHRMSVTTSLDDIWWFNVLDEAHTRWERILSQAMDMVEGSGVELGEEDMPPGLIG